MKDRERGERDCNNKKKTKTAKQLNVEGNKNETSVGIKRDTTIKEQ